MEAIGFVKSAANDVGSILSTVADFILKLVTRRFQQSQSSCPSKIQMTNFSLLGISLRSKNISPRGSPRSLLPHLTPKPPQATEMGFPLNKPDPLVELGGEGVPVIPST